ncbi:MAG: hypothetical protein PVG24_13360 [Gammaproteobacteria bacterium]|jgi:hypothetical protein
MAKRKTIQTDASVEDFIDSPEHATLIENPGKHKYSGGCLHVARLADVDTGVLKRMISAAYRTSDAGPC